jgi:hypothetical protein
VDLKNSIIRSRIGHIMRVRDGIVDRRKNGGGNLDTIVTGVQLSFILLNMNLYMNYY